MQATGPKAQAFIIQRRRIERHIGCLFLFDPNDAHYNPLRAISNAIQYAHVLHSLQ
jgi:hypothetical protein